MKKQETQATAKITVRLSEALIERAKIVAVKRKTTLQDITAEALELWLETHGGQQT